MYHNGEGTDTDYLQAYMWFDLAAAQGHQRGEELRDLIAEKMTPGDIAKAQQMARERKGQK